MVIARNNTGHNEGIHRDIAHTPNAQQITIISRVSQGINLHSGTVVEGNYHPVTSVNRDNTPDACGATQRLSLSLRTMQADKTIRSLQKVIFYTIM